MPPARVSRKEELRALRDAAALDLLPVPKNVDLSTAEWRDFYNRKK